MSLSQQLSSEIEKIEAKNSEQLAELKSNFDKELKEFDEHENEEWKLIENETSKECDAEVKEIEENFDKEFYALKEKRDTEKAEIEKKIKELDDMEKDEYSKIQIENAEKMAQLSKKIEKVIRELSDLDLVKVNERAQDEEESKDQHSLERKEEGEEDTKKYFYSFLFIGCLFIWLFIFSLNNNTIFFKICLQFILLNCFYFISPNYRQKSASL